LEEGDLEADKNKIIRRKISVSDAIMGD